MRIFFSIALFFICFLPPILPFELPGSDTLAAGDTAGQGHHLDVQVKDDRVFVDVSEAALADVLKEISRQARINLTIGEGVKDNISIKFTGVTIEEALRRLCENRAVVFEFQPDKQAYRIVSVGAYSGNKEPPAIESNLTKSASGEKQRTAGEVPGTQTGTAVKREPKQVPGRMYDARGRPLYKPGELLIRFKEGVTPQQIADLHQSLGSTVLKKIGRLRLERIQLRDGLSANDAIEAYYAAGIVEIAERHALRYPNETIPNDTYFSDQWGLKNLGLPTGTPDADIDAGEAWDYTQGSDQVIIAVIDSGVDYLHADLADNIWVNTAELNGSADEDDDQNGYKNDIYGWDFGNEDSNPMDMHGHGTHVAGIIGAVGNNNQGVAGVLWNTKIMALKVRADGAEYMLLSDIIEAVYYAMDNGARIVNCSFGGGYDPLEYSAFSALETAGILAVCAAGNDGYDTDNIQNYPSCYDLGNIISVAASNQSDELATFSNYGLNSVDLMAPGVDIKSTIPTGTYTEASVSVQGDPHPIQYPALGMDYAGTTDENGITGLLYDCGLGDSAEAFPSEVSGNIALIQRGDIYFYEKTTHAQNAGAVAVIIYNNIEPGNFQGTLGGPLDGPGTWVPVVSISKAEGEALQAMGTLSATLVNKPIDSTDNYANKSGTSMATPFVAGVAGLVLALDPNLNHTGIKSVIINSVDKIPSVANKMVSGGRLNARNALFSVDSDGDGIPNDQDAFPNDPDYWLDTDSDGMPDDWELQIVNAAFWDTINTIGDVLPDHDFDGDGWSNIIEYKRGTDPTNPNSHPSKAMPWIPLLLLDN